jgi:hypothetical protein
MGRPLSKNIIDPNHLTTIFKTVDRNSKKNVEDLSLVEIF